MRALIVRRHTHSSTAVSSRTQQAGYTLVELMIVMAITSVLAAVAIPTFQGYVMRGRAGEAVTFLGSVVLRQEAYRSEFGGYAGLVPQLDAAAWVPDTPDQMVDGMQMAWPAGTEFDVLGASPDASFVRFAYAMCAGTPVQANNYIDVAPYNVPAAQLDFYFIAQAQADFDDDGTLMTFEVASFTRNMWFSSDQGWE